MKTTILLAISVLVAFRVSTHLATEVSGTEVSTQAHAALLGVWEPVQVVSIGVPQGDPHYLPLGPSGPGMRIFTKGYYSYIGINAKAPRVPLPASGATADQLMAAWGPVGASVGRYEVRGDTIVMRPTAEKAITPPGVVKVTRLTFRIEGDSLWVNNLRFNEVVKYVRLER